MIQWAKRFAIGFITCAGPLSLAYLVLSYFHVLVGLLGPAFLLGLYALSIGNGVFLARNPEKFNQIRKGGLDA